MPRRIATLITSGLLLVGMLAAVLLVRVPYAEMTPGPTVNTLGEHDGVPVLGIDGAETHETTGHLNMTTVRVSGVDYRMTLPDAMRGWFSPTSGVVPHSTLYPDDRSAEEVDEQNAEQFSRSQESAKAVALRELGHELESETVVDSVVQDSPAEGALHAGDVILEVDGAPIAKPGDVVDAVTEREPGDEAVFTVRRPVGEQDGADNEQADSSGNSDGAVDEDDSEILDVPLTTEAAADDGRAVVGIQAGGSYVFPFTIDIELADVGGPSAGLMFALGLIDTLSEEDLTGGAFIAGTGTIDDRGVVGPIGGSLMKTIAAEEQGAEYFFTPEGNCAQVADSAPEGLTLVEIGTLDDALQALEYIRAGADESLPTCDPVG